jgi:hypothetical protein
MKKILFLFIGVFALSTVMSQTADDYMEVMRDVLKTEKKAAIAEVMNLDESERDAFWDLYNEYNAEAYKIGTKTVRLIREFGESYDKMTDEKAAELWNRNIAIEQEKLKLEKTYFKKFLKIIPAKKALTYFQAENKIETLINAQLAIEVPLFEDIE